MVNKRPKKVDQKSIPKKESAVKKKETTVQKKKSPVKKATTAKVKKTIAKKVTRKPAVKSKPKVSNVKKAATTTVNKPITKKPTVKKSAKKSLKNVIADVNIDIKTTNGNKTQNEKVVNVIDKLSLAREQHYVTTVPGVFRKVPADQKTATPVHKQVPIAGILNYFKGIF
ncbi:MAG: hypothetical protein H8D23_36000 [Candidatus Brocadiales bacterium]|nr:hypothetical protein [Candidatus Brocadiales bacterium]